MCRENKDLKADKFAELKAKELFKVIQTLKTSCKHLTDITLTILPERNDNPKVIID
jgi:hypothetical protein